MDTENCHVCNADTPYPSVSHESVPSLIDNLTYALYGIITKTVLNGRVQWTIPCDPNSTGSIWGYTRNAGEGLMCYMLRVLQSTAPGLPPIGVNGQVLVSLGGNAVEWRDSVVSQATTTFMGGFKLASTNSDVSISTASILALSTTGVSAGTFGSSNLIPVLNIDSKGRVTGASTQSVAITSNQITGISASQVGAGLTSSQISSISSSAIPASGVVAGTFGSSTQIPVLTVDAKGRITVAGSSPVFSNTGNNASDLIIGTLDPARLATSGVSAGTFGSSSSVAQFTVDSKGRITNALEVGISGTAGGTVVAVGAASNTLVVSGSPVIYSGALQLELSTTGVPAITAGSSTQSAVITVDTYGRVTSLATQSIATLFPTGVTAGTYGSDASVGKFTVDANGIVTGATEQTILLAANQVLSGLTSAQIIGISAAQVGAGISSAQIIGISAAQVGSGLTSAQIGVLSSSQISGISSSQISGISAAQVSSGITSAQITSLSATQIGTGLTSAQIVGIDVTQVGSFGSGVATFLQNPSSSNLISVVTDETGTGSLVFGSSPTISNLTVNGYTEGTVALNVVGATSTLAITAGTVLTATLTSSVATTFTLPPVAAGKSFVLYLKQPANGTGTATFVTSPVGNIVWPNSVVPTITAAAGKLDIFSFVSDGFKWYGNVTQNFTY